MKLMYSIIIIFAIIGVLTVGTIVHESVHVIQSEKPISICLDFATFQNDSVMLAHVSSEPWLPKEQMIAWSKMSEWYAYLIGYLFIGILLYLIGYYIGGTNTFKKIGNDERIHIEELKQQFDMRHNK